MSPGKRREGRTGADQYKENLVYIPFVIQGTLQKAA